MGKSRKNTAREKAQETKSFEKAAGFLLLHPYVEKIYINAIGEYHLHKADGFTEYDADDVIKGISQEQSADDGFEDHIVTEEDLKNNPDLVAQGIKVGDVVQIPKSEE